MRRLYVQQIIQHDLTYYVGKVDPRELVRIATKIEVSTPQDAQRPLNGRRVKSIASYVDADKGLLPNTLVIATNNQRLKPHQVSIVDETGSDLNLFYIDFPVTDQEFSDLADSIDVMDGQHRLYSFSDEFRTLKDDSDYEIGFTLFETPTLAEQRKIFMVCNEKQEKVSGNLLLWFKEKLDLLEGAEAEYYPLVNELNAENASPLKGRIIMGGERVTNGIKAQQLIRILNKARIKSLSVGGEPIDNNQRFKLICTYLGGWEDVCGFDLDNPNPRTDGPAVKISGIRYMLLLLPAFWDRSIALQKAFDRDFVSDTIKQFISQKAVAYDEFFTCENHKVMFRAETATFSFAEASCAEIKALDAGKFNPLA